MTRLREEIGPRRGRPRKFTGPTRAVTLTLPEEVIAALGDVDRDLSRAVARVAQPAVARHPHPPAELARFGSSAVIVVNPTRTLEDRTGVTLIPLSDGRALISFDQAVSPARLELSIRDVLEDPSLGSDDARIFGAIAGILKSARQSRHLSVCQRNVIVDRVQQGRPPARAPPCPSQARRLTRPPTGPLRMEDRRLLTSWNRVSRLAWPLALVLAAACGGDGSPSAPTPPAPAHLTSPVGRRAVGGRAARHAAADVDGQERHVRSGQRRAELRVPGVGQQLVQRRASRPSRRPGYAVLVGKTGVPENGAGKTSFQPDTDLQPTTRYYWRARLVQGSTQSEWSPPMTFQAKLVGYNRPGELYDPLDPRRDRRRAHRLNGLHPRQRPARQLEHELRPLPACRDDQQRRVLDGDRRAARPNVPGRQDEAVRDAGRPGRLHHQPLSRRHPVSRHCRLPAERDHLPGALRRRPLLQVRTGHRHPLPLGGTPSIPSTPYFWKFTWGTGTEVRVTVREGGIAGTKTIYNVGVRDAEGRLRAEPAVCLPGRADRPQRNRVRLGAWRDLPQRAGSPTIRGPRRSAAPCAPLR